MRQSAYTSSLMCCLIISIVRLYVWEFVAFFFFFTIVFCSNRFFFPNTVKLNCGCFVTLWVICSYRLGTASLQHVQSRNPFIGFQRFAPKSANNVKYHTVCLVLEKDEENKLFLANSCSNRASNIAKTYLLYPQVNRIVKSLLDDKTQQ